MSFKVNDGQLDSNVASRAITVTAVNDAPQLSGIEGTPLSYTENQAAKVITASLVVSDVDSPTLAGATVSVSANYQSGQDVLEATTTGTSITAAFNSATGVLTLSGADTLAKYQQVLRTVTYRNTSENPSTATRTVSFKVNDGQLDSNVASRQIAITAVNDAPVLNPIGNRTVNEHQTLSFTIAATDVDTPSDELTYSASGLPEGASFDSATRTFSWTPTEALGPGTYQVTFTVTDGELPDSETITITVNEVNEAPTDLTLSATSVAENQPAGTVVGTFTATDQDVPPQSFTYALVAGAGDADNAAFSIAGDELRTAASFDFEAKDSYSIRVEVTDAGGLSYERAFTITVLDVNEAPTDLTLSATSVAENQPAGTVVGTFTATDQDVPPQSFTYALVAGAGDADNAAFSIEGDELRTAASFDFEAKDSYSIRVQVTDAGGLSYERAFTITVLDVNEAPTILLANATTCLVQGDYAAGVKVADILLDDDALGMNVLGLDGAGKDWFEIREAAGGGKELWLVGTFDDQTPSELAVTVTVDDDAVGATPDATAALLFTVVSAGGAYTVAEGDSVQLSGTPAESSTSLVFAWDLDGDGLFGETGDEAGRGDETGVAPVFSALGLDGPGEITVRLRVTDAFGSAATGTATIHVANVAPTLAVSGADRVSEGSSYALALGSVADPGQDTVSQYQIDWGDGQVDTIAAENLSVDRVVSHVYADGEAAGTARTIQVHLVDDDGAYPGAASKTITVDNVAPTLTVVGDQTVVEGQTLSLADLAVFTDPGFDDPAGNPATVETFSYRIDWGDGSTPSAGLATIDTAGQPGVFTEGSFDGSHSYVQSGIYTVEVTLTDDDDASDTWSFQVFYGVPAIAAEVSATTVSNTEVSLSWSDSSQSEIGFVIEQSTDGITFDFAGWASADTASYLVSGLAPATAYWFRVVAYNEIGALPSIVASATTTGVLPLAPTGLTATAVRGSQVELAWTADPASQQDGFLIEVSTDGTSYTEVGTVQGTTATINNLSPWTRYYFRVRAYNGAGVSIDYSDALRLTTRVDLPETPTGLAATATSTTEIALSWTPGGASHEGFLIERSTDGVTFILVGATAESSYTVESLAPGTTYTFRVRAYNVTGKSDYSTTASATTAAPTMVPAAPYYLSSTSLSDEAAIKLSWQDASDNEAGFKIEMSTDGQNFSHIITTSPNCATWTVRGLDHSTLYYFRVRAYNGAGNSAYSNVTSQWTTFGAIAPTVAVDAAVTLDALQTIASLSVLGDDEAGEASLTYTWAATMLPPGATAPEFSANGTNAAKNTTATFNAAGTYWFTVTVTDPAGLSMTSSIMVTVDQLAEHVSIAPTSVPLDAGGTYQFAATVTDQFGDPLPSLPSLTWSAEYGAIDDAGLYTAPARFITDVVTVRYDDDLSDICSVAVTNHAPTVATAAAAAQNPATATATLSVLGADDAGEAGLTYTWSVESTPTGATATFADTNGTVDGHETTVTLDTLGTYEFLVTITDGGGLSVTSTVEITIVQSLTTITLTPAASSVEVGESLQFSAAGYDQFGDPMATPPTFSWSTSGGSITADGLYTAPRACMPATVTVSADAASSSSAVAITNASPTTSCRLGDGYLQAYWEASLGSPETRQARIDQAAGATPAALSPLGPGAGFTIDPTVAFVLANPQNYSASLGDDPAAITTQWETGGIAFVAVEDIAWTLVIQETVDASGAWTYTETYTSTYDITTTADGEAFSTVSGSYSYIFDASGDANGSTYTYTATVNAPVTSPTGEAEWSQGISTTDTITHTTNDLANTQSGSLDSVVRTDRTVCYTDLESVNEGNADIDYSIDYVWDSELGWVLVGTATVTISDGDSYSYSYSDDYVDFGVGWSCFGIVDEEGNDTWGYSYTTNYALLPDGVWQITGGSGGSWGNGFSLYSYEEIGVYWPADADSTISGTYESDGYYNTTYEYQTFATWHDGYWNESGTGNIITDAGDNFSYTGDGPYSNDAGIGTQNESGYENYQYNDSVDYSLIGGAWEVSGGSADYSEDWFDHWDYFVTGGTSSITTEDHSQTAFEHFEEHYDWDADDGWRFTGGFGEVSGDGFTRWDCQTGGSYSAGEGGFIIGDYDHDYGNGDSYEYWATADLLDGAWDYDGSGSITEDNFNIYSYSGSGSQGEETVVENGYDETHFVHTDSYDMSSAGSWLLSDIYRDYTTLGYGSTDRSVSVATTDENGNTSSQGQGTYSSYDYNTTDRFENGGWTYSGFTTFSNGGFVCSFSSSSTEYTRSVLGGSISGTIDETHENYSSVGYTTSSTRNADGSWDDPTLTRTSEGSRTDTLSYSGSGTYWRTAGSPFQIDGTVEEIGEDNYSLSYSGTSVKSDGQWNDSGSGSAVRDSNHDYSYSGTGSHSWSWDSSYEGCISVTTFDATANEGGIGEVTSHSEEDLVLQNGQWHIIPTSNTSNSTVEADFSYDDIQTYIRELDESSPEYLSSEYTTFNTTSQQHVEQNASQAFGSEGGMSWDRRGGDGEATSDYFEYHEFRSEWWGSRRAESQDSWTMDPGSNNIVQGHWTETYEDSRSQAHTNDESYGEDNALELTTPGFYADPFYDGPCLYGIGAPPRSGASAPYGLGSMNTADLLADATGQQVTLAAAGGMMSLAMASTLALPSSPASPSVLFQSTRTGGPSFASYRGSPTGPTFDAAGRLTRLVDANAGVAQFTYDTSGNLASLTDPAGNTTSWLYNSSNRLAQETDALGASRYFAYNDLGNLSWFTDRNGKIRQFGYDVAGNLASETWYANGTDADAQQNATNTINYERDSAGRIISESDDFSSVIYVYNDAGWITSTTQSSVGGPTVTLDYQYDSAGRRTRMAATIDGVADFVDDYLYDSQGRVVSVVEHGVEGGNAVTLKEINIAYNDAGQIVSIDRYENGQLVVEGDYSYDSFGRLIGLTYHQGETVLNSYAWTYSGLYSTPLAPREAPSGLSPQSWAPSGGLMPIHDTVGVTNALMSGGLANLSLLTSCTSIDGTATYHYDPTGQLVGADYTGGQANESYAWDANGNRVNAGYVIGADNRLLSDGAYRYSYDSEGNRTARWIDVNADGLLNAGDIDITEYAWDNRNRLVEVVDRAVFGGVPTQIVDYLYDVENRWIGERIDSNGDGVIDRQIRFAYDGNQIVLQFEKDGEGAVTGNDLSHRYLWQPDAVDQLMADERTHLNANGDVATDELLWALADQQGTVRDLVKRDASGVTAIVDHIIYDSFGKVVTETNPAERCLFKYTGRATDMYTGIEFHGQRSKPAGSVGWMNKDPSGLRADINPYRNCLNSPTNLTDPNGLDAKDPSWWDNIKNWFWTVTGYGAPAGSGEVAGGLACVGEMFQPNNVENYLKKRMDLEIEGTPEWEKWKRRWEECKRMRQEAAARSKNFPKDGVKPPRR